MGFVSKLCSVRKDDRWSGVTRGWDVNDVLPTSRNQLEISYKGEITIMHDHPPEVTVESLYMYKKYNIYIGYI